MRLAHDATARSSDAGTHGWVRIFIGNDLIVSSPNFQHSSEFLNRTKNAKRMANNVAQWLQDEWFDEEREEGEEYECSNCEKMEGKYTRKSVKRVRPCSK